MVFIRRGTLRVGEDLAIDFANSVLAPGAVGGTLRTWGDLVDFLELRGALPRSEAAALRALAETEARDCAEAFTEALHLRETIREMLAALAAGRPMRAVWVGEVNQALGHAGGSERLVRDGSGWRLDRAPGPGNPRGVLAPVARSIALLAAGGHGTEIRRCANPRCVLYFRDRSRTRRRRWCSMAVCGNRMKVAAHARRRRARSA